MICDDSTLARRPLKNREHLAKFTVPQLVHADEHARASKRKDESDRSSPVKKDEADETETGRDRIQKKDRLLALPK